MAGPERTCVGCRRRRSKAELLRVARARDGRATVDPGGAAPGRGAYLCRDRDCAEKAVRPGVLGRALRASLPPEDLARLRVEMERELKP